MFRENHNIIGKWHRQYFLWRIFETLTLIQVIHFGVSGIREVFNWVSLLQFFFSISYNLCCLFASSFIYYRLHLTYRPGNSWDLRWRVVVALTVLGEDDSCRRTWNSGLNRPILRCFRRYEVRNGRIGRLNQRWPLMPQLLGRWRPTRIRSCRAVQWLHRGTLLCRTMSNCLSSILRTVFSSFLHPWCHWPRFLRMWSSSFLCA